MKNLIKSERVRIGLNQAELGAALNPPVSERTVREWEKGNSPISFFSCLISSNFFTVQLITYWV